MKIVYGDEDRDLFHVSTSEGTVLIASSPLAWESEFFSRSMRRLDFTSPITAAPMTAWPAALDLALADHDARGVAVTQVDLDFAQFEVVSQLEQRGFRSVDSRARFVTRISPPRTTDREPPFGSIADLTSEHVDDVLDLVQAGFVENPQFQSRFKNPEWFSQQDAARYYAAWIQNIVGTEGALGAVWVHEGATIGFFLYQRSGERDGIPVYKGILAAVQPEHRGHSAHLVMQSYLYTKMPDPAWLDNTTQLTNISAIRNHMESAKRLESLAIVLYRPGP